MTETATLSRRRKLRFYGWGYADEALSPEEESRTRDLIKRFGSTVEIAPPRETEFELRSPRVTVPQALAPLVSTTPYDRLVHSYGKSYADIVRMFMRDVPQPPEDRKSTRLNSSHPSISYAVFCLKKKNIAY